MPTSSNVLGTGLLAAPLHIHNAIAGGVVVPSFNPTRSRSHDDFSLTPQQSKFNFETRTPTAFGEARTFVDIDFAGSVAFAPEGTNPLSSTDEIAITSLFVKKCDGLS